MNIEIIDGRNAPRKVKKKIYRNNEWVEQVYVRLIDDYGKIERWCIEHYGPPKPMTSHTSDQSWFKVQRYVMMTDKVYVHYSLVNE